MRETAEEEGQICGSEFGSNSKAAVLRADEG